MSLKRTTRSATGSLPEAAVRFESEVFFPGSNNAYTKGREIDSVDFGYDPTGRGDPGFQPHGVGKLPTRAEIEEDLLLKAEEDAAEKDFYDSDYESGEEGPEEAHQEAQHDYESDTSDEEPEEADDPKDSDYEYDEDDDDEDEDDEDDECSQPSKRARHH